MTLTEFLLARIAEDEVVWHDAEYPWRAPHVPDCDYLGDVPGLCTCNLLDRLRAECEAKRRIVAMLSGNLDEQWDDSYEAAKMVAPILGALALPYADHPDYQPEWKP